MIFSIYVLKGKGTPDSVIFDRQVWSPPTGGIGEYDCAGGVRVL